MANEVTLCRLTAKQIGPASGELTRPKIYNILARDIVNIRRGAAGLGSVVEDGNSPKGQRKIELYESPSQVRLNINLTAGVTGGIYDSDKADVAGAAADLSGATQLAKYFNTVSAVTATTADGVKLGASPSVGDVMVVLNSASAAVDVFPNTATSWIDNNAVSAVKSVAVGQSVHFVCKIAGASAQWKSATDENNA